MAVQKIGGPRGDGFDNLLARDRVLRFVVASLIDLTREVRFLKGEANLSDTVLRERLREIYDKG